MKLVRRASKVSTTVNALVESLDSNILRQIKASDLNPVGMIVPSELTEVQFQQENGTGWILADGRNIAGSLYATVTGASTIPDLRGVYLKGKNNGRADGNQDSAGERTLGSFQSSALPNVTGSAASTYFSMRGPDSGALTANNTGGTVTSTGGYGSSGAKGYIDFDASRSSSVYQSVSEARIRNICVNIFIKIN